MADHGLGDTKPIRSSGERAGLHHRGEVDEPVEVQKVRQGDRFCLI
jgi:hypothetical protein